MIPKKIINIWFGKGEKSEIIKKCIDSNKKILDDWEFEEFTEDNYDVSSYKYMQEAYDARKYAFASDCARFDILFKQGGVYIDTDVEFLKKLPDSFLEHYGFSGVEDNDKIASGLVFACEPGNELVGEILDSYRADSFIKEDGSFNQKTVVDRVTEIFTKRGFLLNGKKQVIEGFHIYPCEFFCAYDFITREFVITENTYSIHHYTATWLPWYRKVKRLLKKYTCKVIGKENYKRLAVIKHAATK